MGILLLFVVFVGFVKCMVFVLLMLFLCFPDYGDLELEVKILLDTLHSDSPALTKEQSDCLFHAVLEDYSDISVKRERM